MSPSWFKWWGSIPSRWFLSNIFFMLIVFRDGPEWECKWAQLIISKLFTSCQDREICCYSISCKEKENIDITLKVGKLKFFFEVGQTSISSISVADVTQQVRANITRGRGEYLRVEKKVSSKIIIDIRLKRDAVDNCNQTVIWTYKPCLWSVLWNLLPRTSCDQNITSLQICQMMKEINPELVKHTWSYFSESYCLELLWGTVYKVEIKRNQIVALSSGVRLFLP